MARFATFRISLCMSVDMGPITITDTYTLLLLPTVTRSHLALPSAFMRMM